MIELTDVVIADVEEWARPKPTPNPIEAEAQKPLTLSAAS